MDKISGEDLSGFPTRRPHSTDQNDSVFRCHLGGINISVLSLLEDKIDRKSIITPNTRATGYLVIPIVYLSLFDPKMAMTSEATT